MCVERFYTVFFGVAVFIEMLCGLTASITAAFFGDQVNTWGIIIFATSSVFSVGICYFAIKYVRTLEVEWGEPVSETLSWFFGMCALLILGFIGLIRWLAWPTTEMAKAFIIGPLIVIILVMAANLYVWICFKKLFYGASGLRLDKEKATCGECCCASWNACTMCIASCLTCP